MIGKIIKTAGVIIIGSFLSIASGILLSRMLGPADYGIYNFVISSMTIIYILIVAGWAMLLNREIPTLLLSNKQAEVRGLINLSQVHVFILSCLWCLLVYVSIKMGWLKTEYNGLFLIALGIIPVKTIANIYTSILNALKSPVISQIILTVLTPLCVLIFVLFLFQQDMLSVKSLIFCQIASWLIALSVAYLIAKIKIKKAVKIKEKAYDYKSWYSSLLPFALMAIMQTVNMEIASVMLGLLGTEESVGFFKVSMQGVSLLALVLGAINIVTAPHIATLYKSNQIEETQKLLDKSVKLISLIGVTSAVILITLGQPVINFLFGYDYKASYVPMAILSVGYALVFLMGTVTILLNMTGNEKSVLKTISISLLINFTLLIILVPEYKEIGAAISVSTGLVLWTFLMMIKAYKLTGLKTWLRFSNA